ncbi:MAG: hypothetical protein M3O33_19595 [Cyanobacteriota bacterium]|nr:hypothetical protein [Cyanobacteriota bacterium]
MKNAINNAVQSDVDANFRVNFERIKQYIEGIQNQVDSSKILSPNSKIKVVWWGISEQVEKGNAKKNLSTYSWQFACC